MTADALGFILVMLALGLTVSGFVWNQAVLTISACIAWFLLGLFSHGQVVAAWDIYYCLFIFTIAMFFASSAGTFLVWWRGRTPKEETLLEEDEFRDEKEWLGERRMWRLGGGRTSSSRRLPMPKPSSYSKTGVHEEKK